MDSIILYMVWPLVRLVSGESKLNLEQETLND